MADLVKEMLEKFAALSSEEKKISEEMENALKEYNDYCKSSERDLNEKLQHYRKKISQVVDLMGYAREHAQPQDLEEAQMPFETPEGALESIRQTIKLDSHNDPNAESLYTKASGQKLFYEEEIERTRKLIEGSKVQAKRQYDSDIAALERRKIEHDNEAKTYIESEDFKQYLKHLSFDKSAFNSQGMVNLLDKSAVSIGQRRVKINVPIEIEQDLSAFSKGEYNSAARTIGAPFGVSAQNGGVLILDFDEKNGNYLLGGVQRLLLNFIKYFGSELTDVFFCDPVRCSPDVLGVLSPMAKGLNPFIIVPQSIAEAQTKLLELAEQIEAFPASGAVSRIIVLHDFPENYGAEMVSAALKISRAAEKSGVLLIITHNNATPISDVEKDLRKNAVSIRSRNGAFWIESTRESLFWYSAPSEIPDDVRRTYIEQRRQHVAAAVNHTETPKAEEVKAPTEEAVHAAHAKELKEEKETAEEIREPVRDSDEATEEIAHEAVSDENTADISDAPAEPPEKGSRRIAETAIGSGTDGRRVSLDISGNVTYVCGKNDSVLAIAGKIIRQVTGLMNPDDVDLYLFDTSGELLNLVEDDCCHLKCAIADENYQAAEDIVETISAEINLRAVRFSEIGCGSYSDVPANVYLPRMLVFINDFPVFLNSLCKAPKTFGVNQKHRLSEIFRRCRKYGINFVLIGSTFAENGEKPNVFENTPIDCAVIADGYARRAETMPGGVRTIDGQSGLPAAIPAGCAVVYNHRKDDEPHFVKISEDETLEKREFTVVDRYSEDADSYLEKHAFVVNRNIKVDFNERDDSRREFINAFDDSMLLFPGEPCGLTNNKPIILNEDFGENILTIASERQKSGAASVVTAAILSLMEQSIFVEIISAANNPISAELSENTLLDGIDVYIGESCGTRIRELAAADGNNGKRLVIILGGDALFAEMAAEGSSDILKGLLVNGPRSGCHVMMICGNAAEVPADCIPLFRHRVVFPCPAAAAEKLLISTECELPEGAFRVSGDYEEFTALTYKGRF